MSHSKFLIGIVLPFFLLSQATAQVTINSLRVAEDSFSKKVLAVEFDYDGSFGESISVGAQPVTSRETVRDGYSIASIGRGVSTVNIEVRRPATEDNDTTESWGVRFRFTTFEGRRLLGLTERINLTWPSIRQYYDLSDAPQEVLRSVHTIRINADLENTDEFIGWMAERSNFVDAIEIANYSSEPPAPNLMPINMLSVSEDVSFADLSRILRKIQELEINITGVRFVSIHDRGFTRGMVVVSIDGYMGMVGEMPSPIAELAPLSSLEEIYAARNFQPTPPEEFTAYLLNRIIELNDNESMVSSQQAQDLVELLLERDPDQPRAYVELARSLFRTEECCEQEVAAQNIMNIALNLFPNDPYVNHYAGYVQHTLDEYEKALLLYQIAEQNREEEIIWLTNNWANTLLTLGRDQEALDKFSTLLTLSDLNASDSRAQFYGLTDYAAALAERRSLDAGPVYEKLIAEFPERGRCAPVDYAQYILFAENDVNRARQMLGRGEQYSCNAISAINALVDIFTWYNGGNTGSRPALYSSFLKHPQVDELIYRLANSFDPVPILQALRENGVDLDQKGAYDSNALQQAISRSELFAIRSLASAGADVNADLGDGFTPLLYALFTEELDVIRLLVEMGADPNAMTEFGMSALEIAEQAGDEELLEALRSVSTNDV